LHPPVLHPPLLLQPEGFPPLDVLQLLQPISYNTLNGEKCAEDAPTEKNSASSAHTLMSDLRSDGLGRQSMVKGREAVQAETCYRLEKALQIKYIEFKIRFSQRRRHP
jgi:hypothetical protein